MLSTFNMYIVEKGMIISSYISDKLSDRPDYGKYVFKLEEEMQFNSHEGNSQSPEEFIPDLTRLFPHMKTILKKMRTVRDAIPQHVLPPSSQTTGPLTPRSSLHVPHSPRPKSITLGSNGNQSDAGLSDSSEKTMTEVLENATMRTFFKAFLSNKFCLEMIIFLEQVNLYKMISNRKESLQHLISPFVAAEDQSSSSVVDNSALEHKGRYIIDTFLAHDSMFQINTSQKLISKLNKSLEENGFSPTLFNDIASDMKANVLVHLYEEFMGTELYQEMLHRVVVKSHWDVSPKTLWFFNDTYVDCQVYPDVQVV